LDLSHAEKSITWFDYVMESIIKPRGSFGSKQL